MYKIVDLSAGSMLINLGETNARTDPLSVALVPERSFIGKKSQSTSVFHREALFSPAYMFSSSGFPCLDFSPLIVLIAARVATHT